MESSLTAKSKRKGFLIELSEETSWEQLLEEVKDKLVDQKALFQEKSLPLYLKGRDLSSKEKEVLIKLVRLYVPSPCEVLFDAFLDEGAPSATLAEELEANTRWIEGPVRGGSKITSLGHLMVLGDVNPGAELSAKGNVVVFGMLKGTVHAGNAGDRSAYVAANLLEPVQLRIADMISRSPDNAETNGEIFPEIASVEEDSIFIKPILKKM